MKTTKPITTFAPYEIRRFISPLTIGALVIFAGLIAGVMVGEPEKDHLLAFLGFFGIAYITTAYLLLGGSRFQLGTYRLLNALLTGIGLGILSLLLPGSLRDVFHILFIFGVVVTATISGRAYAYLTLFLLAAITLPVNYLQLDRVETALEYTTPYLISIIVTEVIIQIKNTTQQHIRRLETINNVSRLIMQTLDKEKTLSLLKTSIMETLDADTYSLGIVKDGQIDFEIFYDDGQYYEGIRVPIEGTLSGWVVRKQRELFLPDMREEIALEGVKLTIIGKNKASLSWIGVPLKAENVTGVLALASYTANAFDRADFELMTSLGQHVTLALDNAIRHTQVERQAQLDSLTGVYNHGQFLKVLAAQAEEASRTKTPLSLIMLDIDYFKQYNDTYGHLVGDRILNSLCTAIQHNIKQTDAVGRWGGEEFAISLPGATGGQAVQIAQRISETLRGLKVEDRDQNTVPIPTASQGIAVYPAEADEIFRLIDLADSRLYVAKDRGRNQIEPGEDFW